METMMKKLMNGFIFSLILLSAAAFASTKQINVTIKGMMCSSCAKKMQSKFQNQAEVQAVKVDLKQGTVKLTMKDGKDLTDEQIKGVIGSDDEYSVAGISRK